MSSYGIVKCKHQTALLYTALLYRDHLLKRPKWAVPKGMKKMSQRLSVLFGENISWELFLDKMLGPPSHEERGKLMKILSPTEKQQKIPLKAKNTAAKRKKPENADLDCNEVMSPPKRKRSAEAEVEKKFGYLMEESYDIDEKDLGAWLREHYPTFADSLPVTGKRTTLHALAALLVASD